MTRSLNGSAIPLLQGHKKQGRQFRTIYIGRSTSTETLLIRIAQNTRVFQLILEISTNFNVFRW